MDGSLESRNRTVSYQSPKQRSLRPIDQSARAGVVRRIAAYVETARGQQAPGPSREATFRCMLDLLGAAAAGICEPGVVAIRRTALTIMGAGSAPIWFSGRSSSVIGAAWANSAAASALDLDDGHRLA